MSQANALPTQVLMWSAVCRMFCVFMFETVCRIKEGQPSRVGGLAVLGASWQGQAFFLPKEWL